MEQLILGLLAAVVQAAPGFLALLTGKQTDEEAMEHARASVAKLKAHPVRTALDEYEARNVRADEPTKRVEVVKP